MRRRKTKWRAKDLDKNVTISTIDPSSLSEYDDSFEVVESRTRIGLYRGGRLKNPIQTSAEQPEAALQDHAQTDEAAVQKLDQDPANGGEECLEEDDGCYGLYSPPNAGAATHSHTQWDEGFCSQRLMYSSADRCEAHFVVPLAGQGGHRNRKFSFVAIRYVKFQDGQLLTGWCNNKCCQDGVLGQHVHNTFEGVHYTDKSKREFSKENLVCQEALKYLEVWGGAAALQTLLRAVEPPAAVKGPLIKVFESGTGAAIRSDQDFMSWAVVLQYKNKSGWFCTKCPKPRSCKHVTALVSAKPDVVKPLLPAERFN